MCVVLLSKWIILFAGARSPWWISQAPLCTVVQLDRHPSQQDSDQYTSEDVIHWRTRYLWIWDVRSKQFWTVLYQLCERKASTTVYTGRWKRRCFALLFTSIHILVNVRCSCRRVTVTLGQLAISTIIRMLAGWLIDRCGQYYRYSALVLIYSVIEKTITVYT